MDTIIPLPEYSASQIPPEYSSLPLPEEQSLSYSLPHSRRPRPTGTFIKTKKNILTLALSGQENDTTVPIYDDLVPVDGIVTLENRDNVVSVELKLQGELETTITGTGSLSGSLTVSKTTVFLNRSRVLWQSSAGEDLPPSAIPFSFSFPRTFTDEDGHDYPLPPSHSYQRGLVNGVISKAEYSLLVILNKRSPSSAVAALFSSKKKSLEVSVAYNPRCRPPAPILANPDLIETIKICPEEWTQCLCRLSMHRSSDEDRDDISVIIFLPAVRIFGLKDSIPLHVQLAGSARTLRSLLDSDSKEIQLRLAVNLRRSFGLEVEGSKAWQNFVMGEGTIFPLPPTNKLDSVSESSDHQEIYFDYKGHVRISPEQHTTFGGFHAGRTSVTDFIVLSVIPPSKSRWIPLQKVIPVRFVTDSWADYTSDNYSSIRE